MILGIDPSLSSTGICLINDRGTILHCQSVNHNLEDPYRLAYIYNTLLNVYSTYRPDYICYERQVPQMRFNNSASSIVPLAELAGILKLSFLEYDKISNNHVVIRYPPEDIKRFATGNPKATKEEMMGAVPKKQMKKILESVPQWSVNDVADAYHIANLLRELLRSSKDSINKPVFHGKEYDLEAYIYYYNKSRSDNHEES